MGNQRFKVVGKDVCVEENLVEQISQALCAAAILDLGCETIELHAKQRAARDSAEKIGPSLANRRTKT